MILGRVILAPPERRELKRRARSRSLAVESVRRAKVILMLAAGDSYSEICDRLRCTDRYISLWKERFQQERLSVQWPEFWHEEFEYSDTEGVRLFVQITSGQRTFRQRIHHKDRHIQRSLPRGSGYSG